MKKHLILLSFLMMGSPVMAGGLCYSTPVDVFDYFVGTAVNEVTLKSDCGSNIPVTFKRVPSGKGTAYSIVGKDPNTGMKLLEIEFKTDAASDIKSANVFLSAELNSSATTNFAARSSKVESYCEMSRVYIKFPERIGYEFAFMYAGIRNGSLGLDFGDRDQPKVSGFCAVDQAGRN